MNKRMKAELRTTRLEVWGTMLYYGISSQLEDDYRLKVSCGPSLHFRQHAKQPHKLYAKAGGLSWRGDFDISPKRFDQSRERAGQLDYDAITLWVAAWIHRKVELSVETDEAGRPREDWPK